MTKAEMVRRIKEGSEAEAYFPGVLGNPVTYAGRWGLPLSKGYLAHLARRRRQAANGKPARLAPRRKG